MKKSCLAIGFAFLSFTTTLWAHDVWLVTKGDHLELIYGHETPEVYNPIKISEFKGYDVSGRPLVLKTANQPEAFCLTSDPRAALITVIFDNGYWIEGSSSEWKNVSKEVALTFPVYHHPVKFHKSIYFWSDNLSKPMGLKLEIVPQRNPFTAKGTIPVQVIFDGKPLPNAKVEYGIHGDKAPSILADAEGKTSVPVTTAGEQFMAVDFVPPAAAGADPVSYATSLRFEKHFQEIKK